MAHNFRKHLLYGGVNACSFVSKAGNNANDGLTPDTPKRTLAAGRLAAAQNGRQVVVVGTGTYVETGQGGAEWSAYFVADGRVTVQLPNYLSTDDYPEMHGFTLTSTSGRTEWNRGGGQGVRLYNCTISNVDYTGSGGTFNNKFLFSECIFFDCTGANTARAQITRSLLINCDFRWVEAFNNSYTDSNSPIVYAGSLGMDYNNLQGTIAVGTINQTTYNMDSGPALSFADFLLAMPALNTNSVSQAPGFNNEFARDLSLTTSSVHRRLNIGPTTLRQGSSIFLEGPLGDVSAISGHGFRDAASGLFVPIIDASNLVCTLMGGFNRLKRKESIGGALTGWYKTGLHSVSDTSQLIKRVSFLGGENANTDYPAAENQFDPNNAQPLNNNVPNYYNYTSGDAGRNPNRWEFLMRWSNKDAPDINQNSDFVNNGDFLSFEWGEDCLYNPISGLGNGSPGFLAGASGADAPRNPQAKHLQYMVILSDGYFSL